MGAETLQFVDVAVARDLAEGRMHAVEVNGERVLLALVEGRPYAMGAICTHERANLDEGSLVGHEVYCPLHFSCFDLRTGEALAPPADRATNVYAVRIEDDRVLVSTEPVAPEELGAAGAPSPSERPPALPSPAEPPIATGRGPLPHRVVERIEASGRLETGAAWLGTALRPIREGPFGSRVFDLLHGRRTGHALHPALSDLPIGFWAGAVLLDVIGHHAAGGVLSGAGVAAGVAAAATGVADWTVSDGRDRRVGLLHGITQSIALGIVAASVGLRLGDLIVPAIGLLIAGAALSMASAYLGGHLVLGRGVMVDHTAWTDGPRGWTRTIELAELAEGETRAVDVEGRQVLLSRTDGGVAAIENACSHAGGPLSMGTVRDGVVTCPWHGSCFRLCDGAVVKGPAQHPQPVLETRVRDGAIEVRRRRR
jgi:nitrite reductase/ring-hydroxylating ferredoxin subunit